MGDMAYGLVRILDDEGRAVGPWADYLGALGIEKLRKGLRDMMLTRTVDKRMMVAHRQNKTTNYAVSTGEEAVACGFAAALQAGDMNFPTYRQQGLLMTAGYPLVDFISQLFGNSKDPMEGRQLPVMHSARDYGFFTVSGNLATQYVQAVGWAMAAAMNGDDHIAAAWIGDGAAAEGDFHAALLYASVYKPPVVLNLVNNQWAISSFVGIAGGVNVPLAARALGYGLPALRVDGNDYLAVKAAAAWAAERARRNLGPTMIEWVTYRVAPHSTSDDPSKYRSKAEEKGWPLGDPIERLKAHLIKLGEWSEERSVQLAAELDQEMAAAAQEARALGTLHDGPRLSPAMMFEDVYKDMPRHLREQRQKMGV